MLQILDRCRELSIASGVDHLLRLSRHFDAHLVESLLGPATDLSRVAIRVGPRSRTGSAVLVEHLRLRLRRGESRDHAAPSHPRDRSHSSEPQHAPMSDETAPAHVRTVGIDTHRSAYSLPSLLNELDRRCPSQVERSCQTRSAGNSGAAPADSRQAATDSGSSASTSSRVSKPGKDSSVFERNRENRVCKRSPGHSGQLGQRISLRAHTTLKHLDRFRAVGTVVLIDRHRSRRLRSAFSLSGSLVAHAPLVVNGTILDRVLNVRDHRQPPC